MGGRSRARTATPRRFAPAVVAVLTATVIQLTLTAGASAATQHGNATMTVTVKGLPTHVHASVNVSGPGKLSKRLTANATLKTLLPGTYTVTAKPVSSAGNTYTPVMAVCATANKCSPASHGHVTVKAHKNAVVRVTYAAPVAPSKPLLPGLPAGAIPPAPPGAPLPSGKSEIGGWSVTMSFAAGAPQAQASAVISFPNALPEGEQLKVTYLNEKQVNEPGSVNGCNGDVLEPVASPGYLCVYQGATATRGSLQSEWKNAGLFALENFAGETNEGGRNGELVVFRTGQFNEEAPVTLTMAASLTAAGSWAVTAK